MCDGEPLTINRRGLLNDAAPELLEALASAPVIRLGETLEEFKARYSRWYREVRHPALAKAEGRSEEI